MSGLVHGTTGMVDEKTMHNDSIHYMGDFGRRYAVKMEGSLVGSSAMGAREGVNMGPG